MSSTVVSSPPHIVSSSSLPLCAGHRGFKSKYPENTLISLTRAVDEGGANIVETDIQVTKEGKVVISHDPSTKRCFGVDKSVIDTSYEELSKLTTTDEHHQHMPLFKEVAQLFVENKSFIEKNIVLMLDVKITNEPWVIAKVVSDLREIKDDMKFWANKLVFGVWRLDVLEAVEKDAPEFGVLHIGASQSLARQFLAHSQCVGLSLHYITWSVMWGDSLMKETKQKGKSCYVWTVNTPREWEWAIAAKFDGIITDFPDKYTDLIHSKKDVKVSSASAQIMLRKAFSLSDRFLKFPMLYAVIQVYRNVFSFKLWWFPRREMV